ncbi:hypothetical protein [Bradyrhizobium sp. CCBAU 51745]|uniref:hypothetical protein n=1 Tax=Bradyrhizobium sp. CCBAU 51745 TaxID=1325099 RepID=UPI003FA406BA
MARVTFATNRQAMPVLQGVAHIAKLGLSSGRLGIKPAVRVAGTRMDVSPGFHQRFVESKNARLADLNIKDGDFDEATEPWLCG